MSKAPREPDTPPEPSDAASRPHPMEIVDAIMRKHGHGQKPGEGVAAILRHVAVQMGVPMADFTKMDNDYTLKELEAKTPPREATGTATDA